MELDEVGVMLDNEDSENETLRKNLLSEYVLDDHERKAKPQVVMLPRLRARFHRLYICCGARMPFHVNFPMVVFFVILSLALAVCTIFVALEMSGRGPFVIANAPVWTWGAWVAINWTLFFVLWALFWFIRNLFIRHHYRLLKVTWALYGVYPPLILLFFAVCNFPLLELLVLNFVNPVVSFWIGRIIWVILVLAIFWLAWEAAVRFLIVRIEKGALWHDLADVLWREEVRIFTLLLLLFLMRFCIAH